MYEFNNERKKATSFTKIKHDEMYDQYNFSIEEVKNKSLDKGLIYKLSKEEVQTEVNGVVYWDATFMDRFNGEAPDEVNPSLWRLSQTVKDAGIYKMGEGVYQIRGMSVTIPVFIKGENSWIVHDTTMNEYTSKKCYDLICKHVENLPISHVIYNHSHMDHYGGIKGYCTKEQVESCEVKIIAPFGFIKSVADEQIMAGNIMGRRSNFHLSTLLPREDNAFIVPGPGPQFDKGILSVIKPTEELPNEDGVKRILDGVEFIFNQATSTEAVAELICYVPKYKFLSMGELTIPGLHQLLTLRGAKIRDGLLWAKVLNRALKDFGNDVEILHSVHGYPIYENQEIVEFLENQRDEYLYVHNKTMNFVNKGAKIDELPWIVEEDENLKKYWYTHGYYGSLKTNVKATYQNYLGWFDGTPCKLAKLPEYETGKKWIEIVGEDTLIEKAIAYFEKGEYQWVSEMMNEVVAANPNNEKAKYLLADAYEQIGYQEEAGSRRNVYLQAAMELREGISELNKTSLEYDPDLFSGINPEEIFDYIGMSFKMENVKPEDNGSLNINIEGEEDFNIELTRNRILSGTNKFSDEAEGTINITKMQLVGLMYGKIKIEDLDAGCVDGSDRVLKLIFNNLTEFSRMMEIATTVKRDYNLK